MRRSFREVIWLSFAEADDRYLDLFRVGYVLGLLAFIVLACWGAYRGEPWDPVGFGTGFGAILFGGGVGVGLRGRFEDGLGATNPYAQPDPYSPANPYADPDEPYDPGNPL